MALKPDRIALNLVDHDGIAFGIDQLRGQYSLVYFGFLHCRVVCPRSLAKLAEIMNSLGQEQAKLRVLYISVDPERDTPEAMKAFLETNYPSFVGLTGDKEDVEAAKTSLKVFTRRIADPDDPDGYAVPHTALIYLVDDEGRYVTHFADHLDAQEISVKLAEMFSRTD